jgi:hypothetical protein
MVRHLWVPINENALRRFASFCVVFAPIGGGSDTPKVMQDRQLCCSLVEFFTSFLRRF